MFLGSYLKFKEPHKELELGLYESFVIDDFLK
jgi:hypothetical protein